jgi:hypothetical protein
MNDPRRSEPNVPTERPDPEDAARNPGFHSEDRPGFDLGGAKDKSGTGSNVRPRGPAASPANGQTAVGRASGYADPAGSHPGPGGQNGEGGDSGAGSGPTKDRGG